MAYGERLLIHSDPVNAQRMRPHMPVGRWRGGPYKRGTTVYQRGLYLDKR